MSNLENEPGFNYWFQWQVPVCALIIIIPPIISLVLIYKSNKSPLNVYDLWLGTIFSVQGCWVYLKTSKVENEEGSEFLKREGDETEYNARTSSGLSKILGLNKLMKIHYDCIGSKQNAGCGVFLMQTIYQTSAGAVLLTDIVFWCILVPFLTADTFRVTPMTILFLLRILTSTHFTYFYYKTAPSC
ncbi:hypothetical protein MKX01_025379 [Papaver californicum]|nr:hypothetical protein MKX01_025379 [Papaver californicum]